MDGWSNASHSHVADLHILIVGSLLSLVSQSGKHFIVAEDIVLNVCLILIF